MKDDGTALALGVVGVLAGVAGFAAHRGSRNDGLTVSDVTQVVDPPEGPHIYVEFAPMSIERALSEVWLDARPTLAGYGILESLDDTRLGGQATPLEGQLLPRDQGGVMLGIWVVDDPDALDEFADEGYEGGGALWELTVSRALAELQARDWYAVDADGWGLSDNFSGSAPSAVSETLVELENSILGQSPVLGGKRSRWPAGERGGFFVGPGGGITPGRVKRPNGTYY